ncbi:ABC transporter permease [Herbiconiux sp. YIM B11900]|uniref:ABC transporter permease n=1 Tax=Herbiconiux sp. YIM B11900 TaxID=3404131 RepID=UPI003F83C4D3
MTAAVDTRTRTGRPRPLSHLTATGIMGLITIVLAILSAILVPNFASASNIRALLLSVSLTGIAAVGLSFITLSGRIFSLSIASTIALSTIVFATALAWGPWPALGATVLFGCVVGAIQGIVVGRLQANPIITTIAFSAILLGVGQVLTGGRTVSGRGDSGVFNENLFGVLPFQVLAFVVFAALLFLWQRFTTAGRRISLIGLNERAAAVTGLRAWPYILLGFVICGAATGLAGGLLSAQSGQGNLLLGGTFGFDVIVAVIVGGVAINGGKGSPIGAAIGALFVGLLGNVLALAGLSYEVQLVAKGILVLLAVCVTGIASTRMGGRR